MSDERDARTIIRYRALAVDEPSASLDRAILALARRNAARVRAVRRGAGVCALMLLLVVLGLASMSLTPRPRTGPARALAARTGYGLQAGAVRAYLLTVAVTSPSPIDWR